MSRRRKLSRQEKFGWIVASIVFAIVFIAQFVYGFITHCIFEWPIRWDVHTCWNEQIEPAKYKAAEEAAQFVP